MEMLSNMTLELLLDKNKNTQQIAYGHLQNTRYPHVDI